MPTVTIPYKQRDAFRDFHARTAKRAVLVVHRRGGKTVALINDLIRGALKCSLKNPRFAYLAPTYSQAKDVAWKYLKEFTECIPTRLVSESELCVTLPGDRTIRLYGADNYDRLRGLYFDGIGIDECADMDPASWYDVILPALSDRDGWVVWIGTPKGRDAFYQLWKRSCSEPGWYSMRLPASKSKILPETMLESLKLGMQAQEGAYEREYECSFETPVAGSIYGEVLAKARQDGRVCKFEWNHALPVYSSWDLGWQDSTTVWLWQLVGHDVHWIWHTRQTQRTAAQMALELQETKIPISSHFIPHDGDAEKPGSGKSYKDLLLEAGLNNVVVVPVCRSKGPGIDALRNLFHRSYFRMPYCDRGLEALEAYHSKDITNGGIISKEPHHDWSSHDADAARCAAEALELGLVHSQAARLLINQPPRYPNGAIVDLDTITQKRRSQQSRLAKNRSVRTY